MFLALRIGSRAVRETNLLASVPWPSTVGLATVTVLERLLTLGDQISAEFSGLCVFSFLPAGCGQGREGGSLRRV